jgi:iron complex outermembrane receptor protein
MLLLTAGAAGAQSQPPVKDSTARDSATALGGVRVTADRDTRPAITKLTLPVSASVTAERVQETINLMDPQDAVKYLPSVFIRKRNNGDTQSVMGTRVWGVSSSARSLVFADGVPLTALIANNNTIGGPRWGLVVPETIERVDMMYGPFSAAYAGNSIGAVMEITTRAPEKLEASITQTQSLMPFDLYRTNATYGTAQTSARVANRFGKLTASLSGNYQDSKSQPLSYVTSATFPSGTTGGIPAANKLNAPANVLGATGLLHTQMANATGRITYDITPTLRAAYTLGLWQNDADAGSESYLSRGGTPTFAGQGGFASGTYGLLQQHTSQSLSLRSDTRRDWDVEAVATAYRMHTDRQRFSSSASANGVTLGTAGRVAELSGTGWQSLAVKGAWHRGGALAAHTVSFGVHMDRYALQNPTFNTADWTQSTPVTTTLVSRGDGKTQTVALWAQDSWRLAPALRLTVGGRYEQWKGFDGLNVNGTTRVVQREVQATRFSPKATLAWTPAAWLVSASVGKAYRFATAAELYQLVTTGVTFTSPDPNLRPDNVLATELRAERTFGRGNKVQISLFQDDVRDAIISQFKPLVPGSNTFYSYVSNVEKVRARGVEVVLSERDLIIPGLELSGSATYLDARTLAISGRASATAPAEAALGKRLPNIPDWRATVVATYRPTARLALTAGGRYSGALPTTLDNADVNPNVFQGFSAWFVADAHASYRATKHLTATLGADNLLNRTYFLFHPFPQRTFSTSLKVAY